MRHANLTGRQVSRAQHRTAAPPLQGTPLRRVAQPVPKMSSLRVTIPLGQHLNVPGFVGLTRTKSPFFTCIVTLQFDT